MKQLNVCVVGVGSIGQHHARILASLPNVRLVGIVDAVGERGATIAARYGVESYRDVAELLREHALDAAVVSVPTIHHRTVACELIENGVSVLVEKPIAIDINAAESMIEAAKRKSVVLAVGHVERFNAAVLALKDRLRNGELGELFHIETRRQGPFPAHVKDIGVVMDLAVHDVDLVRFIGEQEVLEVAAVTARRMHEAHEDFLRATMRLDDGAIATVMIDWLTPTKIREITVSGERGMFRVDLLTQDLYFFENSAALAGGWDSLEVLRGINEGRMIRFPIRRREPLLAELEEFIAAVEEQRDPLVTGRDGCHALLLAQALIAASNRRHSVICASK